MRERLGACFGDISGAGIAMRYTRMFERASQSGRLNGRVKKILSQVVTGEEIRMSCSRSVIPRLNTEGIMENPVLRNRSLMLTIFKNHSIPAVNPGIGGIAFLDPNKKSYFLFGHQVWDLSLLLCPV